jgi:gamma-glutamyl-gamma-aminobutyraldehyde dehydrogenase
VTTYDYWQSKAQALDIESRAFIDRVFVAASSGKTYPCINPATNQRIAHVAECDSTDVERAVQAACRSFESGIRPRRSPTERKNVLLAQLLGEHLVELALLESLDMGKSVAVSCRLRNA